MIRFAAPRADTSTTPPATGRLETLGDEIAELAAHIHAANYRLLVRIREFDALFEASGGLWGFRSTAHWLSWRTSIGPLAARERVRVARALGDLPLVSAAMERGELSYSKVRALTRIEVTDGDTERELLEVARQATAAQVERLVRSWRRAARPDEEAEAERLRHERRGLTLFPDEDGSWVVRGRLDPEVGALLEKALDLAAEALYRREDRGRREDREAPDRTGGADAGPENGTGGERKPPEREPLDRRRADAVGLVAESALRHGTLVGENLDPVPAGTSEPEATEPEAADLASSLPTGRADRFQVVVHVDLETLRGEDAGRGRSFLGDDVGVSAETSKRLSCDAGRVVMVHDDDGNVLDVGRRTRTVPAALRRALEHRDGGCVFPACGSRFTDAHHIRHWAEGGETKLDNLVLLCRRHHRAVHEGGARVERTEDGRVRFRRPDGRGIPEAPALPAVTGDPVERFRATEGDRGIRIDAWTAAPGTASGWADEPFDVDLALGCFLD